ncbi:hypothetical protein [Paracoccus salsus]|uniref:hypothetical protein n=1 Tax=Paracoccus salsus TaxID=2911061 RepID=UPI001F383FF9|nr:hypothetical protein [Paracoccus salsus]MCF3972588.1 hypothetical protein [Paracoccus salsus]
MSRITRIAFCALLLVAGAAQAQPEPGDFEDELDIVDESYFLDKPSVIEPPGPRTIIRGQANWTPFNIRRGFSTVHLLNERACRLFLESLRDNAETGCMNVHTGRILYPPDLIGPPMPAGPR